MDEAAFSHGAATARETQGRFEMTADGVAKNMSLEESVARREAKKLERQAKRVEELPNERRPKKARQTCYDSVSPHPRGPEQEDWAALGSTDDLQLAFTNFRKFLETRGFPEAVE